MNERIEHYLSYLRVERGLSENTVSAYGNDLSQLDTFLTEHNLALSTMDRERLGQFFAGLYERGYAPATMARKIAAMKSFFHYLRERGEVAADPTDGIGAPEVKRAAPAAIAPAEVATLFDATAADDDPDGVRDHAMLRLLYATGMRVGELTQLDLSDLNLDEGRVRVVGRGGRERVLPLDEATVSSLRQYVARARPYLARHNKAEVALVLNHRGQRLTRQGFWLIMKALVKDSGLTASITPHTLRHSFATHQVKEGLDLEQLRQLLGHASLSTTQMYQRTPEPVPTLEALPANPEPEPEGQPQPAQPATPVSIAAARRRRQAGLAVATG